MPASAFVQLQCQIYKCIRVKLGWQWVLEYIIPMFLFAILALIKSSTDVDDFQNTTYNGDAAVVPVLSDLLVMPSPYYIYQFPNFINHGASNIALTCENNEINNLAAPFYTSMFQSTSTAEIEALSSVLHNVTSSYCENLSFAVLPATSDNADTQLVATKFKEYMIALYGDEVNGNLSNSRFVDLEDEQALDAYVDSTQYGTKDQPPLGVAIVFESSSPNWKYSIRVNLTSSYKNGRQYNVPETGSPFIKNNEKGVTKYGKQYMMSGFMTIQNLVDSFIIHNPDINAVNYGNNILQPFTLSAFPMPTQAYKNDTFWADTSEVFALFLLLSMLYPVAMIVQRLVLDKEKGIKELMLLMSLRPAIYMLAWYIVYVIGFFLLAFVLTAISRINLFVYSELSVVFVYLLLYLWSSITFSFFISSIFNKAKTAMVVAILGYFIGYFLFVGLDQDDISRSPKAFVSLVPSAAFCFGTKAFQEKESVLVGVKWDNIDDVGASDYPFSTALGMLIFDTILYAVLAWYFDNVLASPSGARRNGWCFMFSREFWCGAKKTSTTHEYSSFIATETRNDVSSVNSLIEPVSEERNRSRKEGNCVIASDLTKVFDTANGKLRAVDKLNLSFYEGEITVLLGHNGAGKTTTMSMLTGLLPLSSGSSYIYGMSVESNMKEIRKCLGMNPQQNILFDELSVRDNLKIFGLIKGVSTTEIDSAVVQMVTEVGLSTKIDTATRNLSGGQKRKIQLAMAFIGDSKFVCLDEPTSGMDPYSRRFTWEMIERHKEGRIILLTTHFMDEADILGDRIAIMNEGKLECFGSSLFLKKQYGCGYELNIEKGNNQTEKDTIDTDVDTIEKIVCSHVPEAEISSNIGTELKMQLPLATSSSFEAMLRELYEKGSELGIIDLGVSVTTLEQVFLRVASGYSHSDLHKAKLLKSKTPNSDGNPEDAADAGEVVDPDHVAVAVSKPTKAKLEINYDDVNEDLFSRHLKALFKKRYLYFKRDKKAWCCQLLLPLVFILIGLILMKISPRSSEPTYTFTFADYNTALQLDTLIPFNQGDGGSVSLAATTEFMDASQGVRIDVSQPNQIGDIGPTEGFCRVIASQQVKQFFQSVAVAMVQYTGILDTQKSKICNATSLYPSQALNFSEFLLDTIWLNASSRYGATMINILDSDNSTGTQSSVLYNFTSIHSLPIYTNLINNNMLRRTTNFNITASSHPLPRTQKENSIGESFSSIAATINLAIGYAFVPASFALFIVREKENKAFHQQLLNGVRPKAYWLSNWIFDYCSYLLVVLVTIALLFAFDVTSYTDNFGIVLVLFLLFGATMTSFTYCWSFAFDNASSAQLAMILLNLFAGMILMMVAFSMNLIDSTWEINDVLVYVYRLIPAFCFAYGLLQVSIIPLLTSLLNSQERAGADRNVAKTYSAWDTDVAGMDVIYLFIEFFVYTGLLIYLQNHYTQASCIKKICKRKNSKLFEAATDSSVMDADVLKEEARIKAMANLKEDTNDIILVRMLNKKFSTSNEIKVAVKSLSFGLEKGICFGLLGINGAGKTTTLSMLSGELRPTNGEIFVAGVDMVNKPQAASRLIGFCPQFDAIFPLLTGMEHLEFYCDVKGIPKDMIKQCCDDKISHLTLDKHASRLAGTYSGGNKRKLSVAMATLGAPPVVLLDEPSTGMDPVSRRFMWEVISDLSQHSTVILTTHSLEECEALCSKLTIMVDGEMKCLGTTQHLKSIYGHGYELEINVQIPSTYELALLAKETIPSCSSITLQNEERHTELQLDEFSYKVDFDDAKSAILKKFPDDVGGKYLAAFQKSTLFLRLPIDVKAFVDWFQTEMSTCSVISFLKQHFNNVVLKERNGHRLKLSIDKQEDLLLADVFGLIESHISQQQEAGTGQDIQSYSLGITSLEQIFNGIARTQKG